MGSKREGGRWGLEKAIAKTYAVRALREPGIPWERRARMMRESVMAMAEEVPERAAKVFYIIQSMAFSEGPDGRSIEMPTDRSLSDAWRGYAPYAGFRIHVRNGSGGESFIRA